MSRQAQRPLFDMREMFPYRLMLQAIWPGPPRYVRGISVEVYATVFLGPILLRYPIFRVVSRPRYPAGEQVYATTSFAISFTVFNSLVTIKRIISAFISDALVHHLPPHHRRSSKAL